MSLFSIPPAKLLGKKSQSGIALILFIEIMDKELLKYEVENIRWWYVNDEHGKQKHFSVLEKRPHNMAVALHACFVTGSLLCKGVTV